MRSQFRDKCASALCLSENFHGVARGRISRNHPQKSVSTISGRTVWNTTATVLKKNNNTCILEFENKLF